MRCEEQILDGNRDGRVDQVEVLASATGGSHGVVDQGTISYTVLSFSIDILK